MCEVFMRRSLTPHARTFARSIPAAVQMGTSAFVVEGITFMLLQPGAGGRAQRNAMSLAAVFALVSARALVRYTAADRRPPLAGGR